MLRSGKQVVEDHHAARSRRIGALMSEYERCSAIAAECPTFGHMVGWAVRSNVEHSHPERYTPFEPTAENFRKAASDELAFSRSSWYNHLDTEYYSACGYDDYQYECREEARKIAIEYFRAWKYLTGK